MFRFNNFALNIKWRWLFCTLFCCCCCCWGWFYHLSDSMNITICRDYCTILECSDTEGVGSGFFCILTHFFIIHVPGLLLCPQELCWSEHQALVMGRAGEKCPAGSTVREKVYKENNLKNLKSQKDNSYLYWSQSEYWLWFQFGHNGNKRKKSLFC